MKRLLGLFLATSLLCSIELHAEINSVDNSGYLSRAEAMFNDENYQGCVDQLGHLDRECLPLQMREQADWLLAQSAYRTSSYRSAMGYFRFYLASYPESPRRMEALKRIGDCFFGEENFERALKIYERVSPSSLPGNLRETLSYRIAYCKLRSGNYDDAALIFENLSKNKTWGNASRFYLGYIAYQEKDFDKALELFRTVNTSTKPGALADYYLSQIYFMKGDYTKALSTSRSLLRRDSGTIEPEYLSEVRRIAGESLYREGRKSEGLEYLRQYLSETDSPELTALYLVGVDSYENGNYSEAVEYLQPVSASLFDGVNEAMAQSSYLYIGQSLYRQGEIDAALLAFDAALKSDADKNVKEAAYYNYAVAKFAGGNIPFGSSVTTFEDFLKKYPDGPYSENVKEYLVAGYLADDNLEKSLDGLEKIPNPTPRVFQARQQVLYRLGGEALKAADADKALSYLSKADKLKKYDSRTAAEVTLLTGEAQMLKGNNKEAENKFREYLNLSKNETNNRPYAYYALGYALFGMKDYDEARNAFQSALKITDNIETKADIYNRLGDINYYSSEFGAAAECYDKSFELLPGSGDYALFQNALMKGFLRDYKAKENLLEKFRSTFPESALMPDAMLEETEALLHLNQPAKAVDLYREMTETYATTAQGRQGYLQMALTLLNMGKTDEGIEAYKEVIRRYPSSEEATQAANFLKNIYMNQGKPDSYIAFMKSVEGAPMPDSAEIETMAFEAAEKDLTLNGSTAKMEKYLAEYPNGSLAPRALELLMETAHEKGDNAKAYEYAKTIVSRFPNNSSAEKALIIKANREYELGRGNAALDSWKELEKKASSPDRVNIARIGIMRVSLDLADYPQVLASTEALLSTSTVSGDVRDEATFVRALALYETEDIQGARKLWKTLSSNTDNLYGAKSAYYLAESFYDDEDFDSAMKTVQGLTSSGTPHKYWLARGFILMSDIYSAQGKDFEAKEYLRALKENYPGSESDIFEMIESRLN